MTPRRIEICRDVWLNIIQTERFKTGSFSINLLQPLAEETASAHALIPSVLLRGCSSYPDMQKISDRLDELYGAAIGSSVRKKGEVQTIGLYSKFLEDRYANEEPIFAQIMAMIRDLMFSPVLEHDGFRSEFVSSEKQNLLNTIESRINDKRSYAVSRLLKIMCAGEAYRVHSIGEKEALEQVNGKMLYDLWRKLLKTSRIEMFYMGQHCDDVVIKQVRMLADLLPERGPAVSVSTEIRSQCGEMREVSEALDVTQGKLSIGLRTPITVHDPRYPAMMLLNAVYGNGMTSKLFTKIREEQSLCYYASSSYDKFKGIVVVNSGIEFDHYSVAKDGILEQLELCKKGDITDEELESARQFLISALRSCNDSPSQLDNFIIGNAVCGVHVTLADTLNHLRSVTKEQVVDAACTLVPDTVYFLKGVQEA